MNILTLFLLPLAVVALLAMPLVPVYRGITTGRKAKHAVVFNLCAFFGVAALMMILPIGNVVALAAEEAAVAEVISTGAGMGYLAAAPTRSHPGKEGFLKCVFICSAITLTP